MGVTSLSVHPATHPLGTHSCPALHPGGGDSQVRWQQLSLLLPGAPVPYKRHDVGEEESPVELECQGIPPRARRQPGTARPASAHKGGFQQEGTAQEVAEDGRACWPSSPSPHGTQGGPGEPPGSRAHTCLSYCLGGAWWAGQRMEMGREITELYLMPPTELGSATVQDSHQTQQGLDTEPRTPHSWAGVFQPPLWLLPHPE